MKVGEKYINFGNGWEIVLIKDNLIYLHRYDVTEDMFHQSVVIYMEKDLQNAIERKIFKKEE